MHRNIALRTRDCFHSYRGCWVERSETQKIEQRMLGFVPQPNLQLMLIFNAIFIFKIS
jgi:hypothetical protein